MQKAGLFELTQDDRAVLLGGMLALADLLSEGGDTLKEAWHRRGKRLFAAESKNDERSAAQPLDHTV